MSLTVPSLRHCVEKHGLLAKWRETDFGRGYERARGFKLGGHMEEVHWALNFFFEEPLYAKRRYDSTAHALYQKMRLHLHGCSFEEFSRLCYLATLAHDLGKAGGEFQWMLWMKEMDYSLAGGGANGVTDPGKMYHALKGKDPYKQAYRHEFLSAVILFRHPEIRAWFETAAGSPTGFARVLAGAFGHHRKGKKGKAIRDDVFDETKNPNFAPKPVFLRALSNVIRTRTSHLPPYISPFAEFPVTADWEPDHPAITLDGLTETWFDLSTDPLFHLRLDDPVSGAIKWMVILADTFGSLNSLAKETLPATRTRLESELKVVLSRRDPAVVAASYDDRILKKLRETLTPEELSSWRLKGFQKQCSTVKSVICPIPTGGGKTIGGLVFGKRVPEERLLIASSAIDPVTRAYYEYGLLRDGLLHSRRDLDVKIHAEQVRDLFAGQSLTPTPGDDPEDVQEDADDAAHTIDVLKNLGEVVTFTTADQVLGLMTYYHGSVVRLPYLLTCSVVFDEVGSYDPTMLAWYFRFLEWFPGIRTAHFSATMTDAVMAKIATLTRTEDPRCKSFPQPRLVRGPRLRGDAALPRYIFHIIDEAGATSHFTERTLWVVNTVGRCKGVAQNFADSIAYHSRFKFNNRWDIRDHIVRLLPNPREPELKSIRVVATQVIGVSFDICAWNLITELCPPEEMVQRPGRANRDGKEVAHVYVYKPSDESGLPYVTSNRDWVTVSEQWLNWVRGFEGRPMSQVDLDRAFQDFYEKNPPDIDKVSSSLFKTYRHNVRSGSFATNCLLADDYQRIRALNLKDKREERLEVLRVAVPLLLPAAERRNSEFFHKHAVVEREYDPRLGVIDPRSP